MMINKQLDKITNQIGANKYYQYSYFILAFLLLLIVTVYAYPIRSGHDLNFHFIRLDSLVSAIKDGSFPVYIDHESVDGYGYGTKWFYSDFILIPFAYLAQYIDLVLAYKIMIVFYTVLCGFISYLSLYKVSKRRYIGFIFSILYTFSFYRLYDVYSRAALGESICLTFVPLVVWGAYEMIKGNYKKWYVISIAFAFMILSHVITSTLVAVMTAIVFICFYKSILKEPVRLVYLSLAVFVTLLLTAYFVFPFIEQLLSNDFYFAIKDDERNYAAQEGMGLKDIIRGLFWGIAYVYPTNAGLGIIITICVMLRITIFRDKMVTMGDFALLFSFLLLFAISSFYPWKTFPFSIISFIQYPWRLYSIAIVTTSISGAIYFYKALKTDRRRYWAGIPLITILTTLLLINSGKVFRDESYSFKQLDRYIFGYSLIGAEYLPQKNPDTHMFFVERGKTTIIAEKENTEITNYKKTARMLSFDAKVKGDDILEVPYVYYKGYKATLNDKQIDVRQSEYGLVEVPVDESGQIKVYFGGTLIQNISPYITLISIVLLIGYIVWFDRKNKTENDK